MHGKEGHRYIFVVGGVMSGVGKGVSTASIGRILEANGQRVSLIKVDPYLNVDAGTMNPTEHGEVFVLESGLECDQDMGNYERFLNRSLPDENYMTNGMVFKHVIDKERRLEYDGKCVEPTFHITQEILRRIEISREKTKADVTIVEVGGTIGEYQNAIFIEAARRLKLMYPDNVMFVLVSYLPTPPSIGEMKTKPTQNAVRQLNSYGVSPNIIIGRAEEKVDKKRKLKIAQMCGVPKENVISAPDVENIYEVPLNFAADGLGERIIEYFGLRSKPKGMRSWQSFVNQMEDAKREVKIGIVGKYFHTGDFLLSDAYISVIEALKIAAAHAGRIPVLDWLSASDYEEAGEEELSALKRYDGLLVPGGFGETGIEGKIAAIKYARKNKIPYFGLCYGMQLMVVEYARNVAGMSDAHTTEINPDTTCPVIDVMPDQKDKLEEKNYGGTMRLGAYRCQLSKGTIARGAYGKKETSERHRHRFEVNPRYVDKLEEAGLVFSGSNPETGLVEIAELSMADHPFFLGTQFHPEFQARPLDSHPLFDAFINAASKRKG